MDKENTKETDIKKVNLTQTASKGAFWSLLSSTVVSAVRFVVTAVLARLLMPEDFGLIGMALLVTQIVNLFGNLGLSAALIHRNKDVDDEDLSTSYWANLFVSTVLTLLAVIVSPIAARFFGEPRVQMIIALLSLNFIFSSFASIHSMLAFKDLKFKKIAIIEILCTLVRVFIVLILAFKGFGVWAIVSGILVERIVKSMTFISQNSWRPRLIFNKNKFKELFHFGKNLYAGSFISYFNCNMDYIVTGRFLGAADLGFYQFAFNIPNLIISHFTQKINEVLFPLYSKVKDDLSRVRRGYFKSIQLMAMIAFPFLMGLFFVAREFIITVYGEKWLPSVIPLQILCFAGMIRSCMTPNGSLLMSRGRPDIVFKWSLFMLPITIISIIVSARWGILGVAIAMVLVSLISSFIIKFCFKLIEAKLSELVFALSPATFSSLLMLLVMFSYNKAMDIHQFSNLLKLFFNFVVGGASYLLILAVFFRKELNNLVNIIESIFKKH